MTIEPTIQKRNPVTREELTQQTRAILSDLYAGQHYAAGKKTESLLQMIQKGRIVGERNN